MAPAKHNLELKSAPILVFWEITKACLLSCLHCRASAQPTSLPGQLSTEEGVQLLEQVEEFGTPLPVVVFTGGDPLMRPDLFPLLRHARSLGLRTAVAPSVTPLLTMEVLRQLKAQEVGAVSISVDGATPETHDNIRGVGGTFEKSLLLLREAVRLGLNVQVNTAVMRSNTNELADIFHLVMESKVKNWEVFFLIRTGRALEREDLTSVEYRDVCNFLYDASCYGITIRSIEAPFIRRISMERNGNAPASNAQLYDYLHSRLLDLEGLPKQIPYMHTSGTLDGDGTIFIAYDGKVYPGGFLPFPLGNIREERLAKLYRRNELLIKIRNRELKGKCGACSYKANCGGSRARAYAYYGDPLASDPACPYFEATPSIQLSS